MQQAVKNKQTTSCVTYRLINYLTGFCLFSLWDFKEIHASVREDKLVNCMCVCVCVSTLNMAPGSNGGFLLHGEFNMPRVKWVFDLLPLFSLQP